MSDSEEELEHKFVGRDEDLKTLNEAWKKYRMFVIWGFADIGKSRLSNRWLKKCVLPGSKNHVVVTMDFKNMTFTDEKHLPKFWKKMCQLTGEEREDIDSTIQQADREYVVEFMEALKSKGKSFVFLFESVEQVKGSAKKYFTTLLSIFINSRHVKTVITSTVKIKFAQLGKAVHYHHVGRLPIEHAKELLQVVAGEEYDFEDYLEPLAAMCDGLPVALIGIADQIRSSEGILKPREMLEVLCINRIHALQMELYPTEDQLPTVYGVKLNETLYTAFHNRLVQMGRLGQKFSSTEVKKALQQLGYNESEATTKFNTIMHLVDMSALRKSDGKGVYVEIHDGVLRDYLNLVETVQQRQGSDGENSKVVETLLKCIAMTHSKSPIQENILRDIIEQQEGVQRAIEIIYGKRKHDEPAECVESDEENGDDHMEHLHMKQTEEQVSLQSPTDVKGVRAERDSMASSGPQDTNLQQSEDLLQNYMAAKEPTDSFSFSGRPDNASLPHVMHPQPEEKSAVGEASGSHKLVTKQSSIDKDIAPAIAEFNLTSPVHAQVDSQIELEYYMSRKDLLENRADNPKNEKDQSLRDSYDSEKMENLKSDNSQPKRRDTSLMVVL